MSRFGTCALLAAHLVGCAAGVQTVTGPTVTSAPKPASLPESLQAALDAVSERLVAIGLEKGGPSLHGFIPSGTRQSFELELPARTCLTLVALATDGIIDMDAALYTADGQLLAADSQPDSHPAIQACVGDHPRRYYYVLHSYDGSGTFAMGTFEGPRTLLDRAAQELGGRPALALDPDQAGDVEDAIMGLAQGLQRRGYQREGEPLSLMLAQAQRIRMPITVAGGQCYAVAAFGGEGLSDVNLRILDDRGREVAGDRAPLEHAQVQFCANGAAEYAAETEAQGGAGEATVVVFHGAAHRVLSHSGLWVGQSEASKLGQARPLSDALAKLEQAAAAAGFARPATRESGYLQPGEVIEHDLLVRAGHCYRFMAAGDAGLNGLGVEVPDAPEALVPATAGPEVTPGSPELCADRNRLVRIRLTAKGGTGQYVLSVLER